MNTPARIAISLTALTTVFGCSQQTATMAGDGVIFGELTLLSPTLDDGSRYAEHPIQLEVGEALDVTMQSTDFDTYLRLADNDGIIIAEDDDSAGGTNANLLAIAPKTGTYTIVANTFDTEEYGEYILAVRRKMTDNLYGVFTGVLPEIDGKTISAGAYPTHDVPASAGDTLIVRLASAEFDTLVQVRDSRGDVIAEDDDSAGGTNSSVIVPIRSTGTYSIAVRSFGDEQSGTYTLTVQIDAAGANSRNDETRRFSGQLTRASARLADDTPFDAFAIEAAAGEQLQITMTSDAFDSYLQFQTSDGYTLALDDDSGGGLDSQLTIVTPEAGSYNIIANSVGSDATGAYEITLSRRLLTSLLESGDLEVFRGVLSEGQQMLADGTPMASHTVEARAGERLRVTMTASEFDAYLVVFDGNDEKISEDDDSGGGTNARLSFIAPTDGTYQIVANSFVEGAEGNYMITLERD